MTLKHPLGFSKHALVIVLLIVAGCTKGPSSSNSPPDRDPSGTQPDASQSDTEQQGDTQVREDTEETTPETGSLSTFVSPEQAQAHGLATSQTCTDCHSNDGTTQAMLDNQGTAISPFDLWSSSMKANSARDPFFRAVMSAEKYRHPDKASAIEQTCLRCHSPLASVAAERMGETLRFEDIQEDDALGQLGADGVSCVSCHAMTDANFGTPESYHGGFELNDDKEIYGPHPEPFAQPMETQSGFEPVQGSHVNTSEACATCHTLHTHTIIDGEVTDNAFPEQTPYLEWKNSDFSSGENAQSCQDCHMPTTNDDGTSISTRIARRPAGGVFPPTAERSSYGKHLFIGGNYTVPGILRDERDLLSPVASDAAFDATIAAVKAQLKNDTASLRVENVEATSSGLSFDVVIENKTGHKFPTSYPSRRAWIHARVLDRDENVLFESGRWNEAGQIVGESGPLAFEAPFGPIEPHRDRVTESTHTVIYEAVMERKNGDSTVALLRAYRYHKDNRLLPFGWSADHAEAADTEPVGVSDDDFVAGRDTITFDLTTAAAPAVIEVELVYQPLGARWLAELFEVPTAEIERFEQMFERSEREPALVAEDRVELE